MTIPAFDLGLTLPPFLGPRPGSLAFQSPYEATADEVVHRFGTSVARNEYLRGWLTLRRNLREFGIVSGFQWLDGSFVEDKERRLGVGPGDIDLVTCFNRPPGLQDDGAFRIAVGPLETTLFDPGYCKATYHCEAFYIDLGRTGKTIANLSAFWFSLFSHQRETFRWKGIVRVALGPANVDDAANAELIRRGFP